MAQPELKLYNTLSGKKEIFQPLNPAAVLIYVCGITTYDDCHLGHLRVATNFALITDYLRHQGYKVKYVRNITDVDDKIIKRALAEKRDFLELSRFYTESMQQDFRDMGLTEPDLEPRATSYLSEMINFIKNLEQAAMTYQTPKGDVCYRVRNFKNYGKLSKKKLDELQVGVRIEEDESKEDPLDFVLWKIAKEGEPAWDSPWGPGRPGWHIECSTMVNCCLGKSIDIHGGGHDLIFPHHENEIAQSEAANQTTMAKYWMHCGHMMINGKKMSKSLNNFITIKELVARYHPELIKYFIFSAHYRSQMDFSIALIERQKEALDTLYRALTHWTPQELKQAQGLSQLETPFYAALADDFNTPLALSVLFELARVTNKEQNVQAARSLLNCARLLGLLREEAQSYLKLGSKLSKLDSAKLSQITALVNARTAARKNKQWARSDELRAKLKALGVIVEDRSDGSTWRLL